MTSSAASQLIDVAVSGSQLAIEWAWVGVTDQKRPLLVFLHEGLGSVSMWRDFPEQLCQALGVQGLVYSRAGYGRSAWQSGVRDWTPDYMHAEALQGLPAVLRALSIDHAARPVWLIGHSDGGSIALIAAASAALRLAGVVVLAPHILVEDLTVRSIERARDAYRDGALRASLARHHADPGAVFWRWNRIWLSEAFRSWSIESELASIRCPVLAVQGVDDPYGTLAQVYGIQARVPATRVVELPDCGHSPHRDQPECLLRELVSFIG